MPNAPHACRIGARVARARPRPLPSALLAVLLLCPVACASGQRPKVFRAMRDALAQLDDFGALLLEAGLPADTLPTGPELTPQEATRLRIRPADDVLRVLEGGRQPCSAAIASRLDAMSRPG